MRADTIEGRILAYSVTKPVRVILVCALVTALAFPGLFALRVETGTDSILDKHGPEWLEYQRAVSAFGGDEFVSLVISSDEEMVPELVRRTVALTSHFEGFPGVARVDSVASIPALLADETGNLLLSPATEVLDREHPWSGFNGLLERHNTGRGWLFSTDRKSFAVNLVLDHSSGKSSETVMNEVASIAGVGAAVSGVPVFRAAADKRMRKDLAIYGPVTFCLVVGLLVLLLGSWTAALSGVAAPLVSVAITMSAMGSLGVPVTITTSVLPPILLSLGCAYSMHLLCATRRSVEVEAGGEMIRVARPLALSALTTAIGFLGIGVVRIEAINQLGLFGALGVAILCVLSLTLTPALIRVFRVVAVTNQLSESVENWSGRIWRAAARWRALIVLAWAGLLLLSLIGIARVSVSTNVIEWFRTTDRVRVDYDKIRRTISGISPITLVIRAGGSGSLVDTRVVEAIADYCEYLRGLDGVGHVMAYSDYVLQLSREFGGSTRLAGEGEVEQLLLLLETDPIFASLLSPDRSAAGIWVRVNDNSSAGLKSVAALASQWWEHSGIPDFEVTPTGVMMEFARAEDEIVYGQLRGFCIAILSISVLIWLAFKNAAITMVCTLVNVVPVVFAISWLGFFAIPLDAATIVLACLALGIAVDDSVHFLWAARARAGKLSLEGHPGLDRIRGVAVPVVFSSIALGMGFSVLAFSGFLPVSNLGLVTAGAIGICLLADMSLLPALIGGHWDAEVGE